MRVGPITACAGGLQLERSPSDRSGPPDAPRQFVVCSLAGEEHALAVEHVQEIIRYAPPRPLPSAPSGIGGVRRVGPIEVRTRGLVG